MRSTGNDIIARDLINKERSNDSRFYTKILSPSEKELYDQPAFAGMDFDCFVWLCWSVKESAYKYLKRVDPALVFSPVQIILQQVDLPAQSGITALENGTWEGAASAGYDCRGSLSVNGSLYYFRSKICSELIATIVSADEKFEQIFWGIRSISKSDTDTQSKAVRSFFLKKLHAVLPGRELRVEKTVDGVPIVLDGAKQLSIPVSFSHHGIFIAYSFRLVS